LPRVGGKGDRFGKAAVADVHRNRDHAAGDLAPPLRERHPLIHAERGELAGGPADENAADARVEVEPGLLLDRLEVEVAASIEWGVAGGDEAVQRSGHGRGSRLSGGWARVRLVLRVRGGGAPIPGILPSVYSGREIPPTTAAGFLWPNGAWVVRI